MKNVVSTLYYSTYVHTPAMNNTCNMNMNININVIHSLQYMKCITLFKCTLYYMYTCVCILPSISLTRAFTFTSLLETIAGQFDRN